MNIHSLELLRRNVGVGSVGKRSELVHPWGVVFVGVFFFGEVLGWEWEWGYGYSLIGWALCDGRLYVAIVGREVQGSFE